MPKLLTKENIKIYYNFLNKKKHEQNPDSPVLIFVHGRIVNWTCFKNEINFFRKKAYPVIYLDLRGHGKSDKPDNLEDYHISLMVEDLAQVLKKEQVRSCVLIGHSMGGMVACMFTVSYPHLVKRLILIDSSYKNPLFSSKLKYFNKHIKYAKLLTEFIAEHTKIKPGFNHVKELDISKLKSKPDIFIFLDNLIHTPLHSCFAALEEMFNFDLGKQLPDLKMPVLVIASDNDQFFSLRMERNMQKKIPSSKLLVEQGTRSVIIKKPDEIAARIQEFIA